MLVQRQAEDLRRHHRTAQLQADSSSSKVTRLYSAAASHTNYNLGVDISHEPEEQWISGAGNALAYVTWHGSIIYRGFGVNIDKRHHLRCDETGLRCCYLKNV